MKNVIITGTSRGIGIELVKIFNSKNFNVFSLTRDYKSVSNLKLKNVHSFHLDISDEKSISNAVSEIINCVDSVDILINNAGSLINKPFLETTLNDFQRVYSVNVLSLIHI